MVKSVDSQIAVSILDLIYLPSVSALGVGRVKWRMFPP